MHKITLTTIDTDILIHRIAERTVYLLKKEQQSLPKKDFQENLLTREEAMRYLRITAATLWRWERDGKIQSIGIGGKRYFRKSDINASLIKRKGGNNG